MATGTHCAPRAPLSRHSLAAVALAMRQPDPETEFVAAWVAAWQACGGALMVDKHGQRVLARRADGDREYVAEAVGATNIILLNPDEISGALKVLASLLDIAGPVAITAVFQLADHARKG